MKTLFALLLCCFLSYTMEAQLNNGATAPNWTMTDINGTSHTLYDDLNLGKVVVLDFSAAYCPTCWSYHNTHALKDFYTSRGPNAANYQAKVYFIEMLANNTTGCLYGPGGGGMPYQACNGSSAGNWVTGTPYPIIDNASQNTPYNINFYPTVYMVCPNKTTYLVGQQTSAELDNSMQSLCGITPGGVSVAPLAYQSTSNHNACFGGQNGSITLSITGGTPPYSYLWSNATTSASIANLAAGNYQATITDSQNKTLVTSAITITQGTAISVNATIKPYEKCGTAGTIALDASGGKSPYTYQWSSNTPLVFTSSGTYSTTVTDVLGCSASKSVSMTGYNNQPTVSIPAPSTLTCNVNEVHLNPTISPSSNFYTSTWTSVNGGTILNQTQQNALVNAAGNYTFKVTDSQSKCSATTLVSVIENKVTPIITFPTTTPSVLTCKNIELTLASTITQAGNTPVFNWTGGTFVAGQNTASATVNTVGTYQLDVLNPANGCHASSAAISITEDKTVPSISFLPSTATILTCKMPELTLAPTIAHAGNTPVFNWTGGAFVAGQNTASATVNTVGTYQLDVLNPANGCHLSSTFIVSEVNKPMVNIIQSTMPLCFGDKTGSILINTGETVNPVSYHWSNGTTSMNAHHLEAGTYGITVTDAAGCTASNHATLTEPKLLIPMVEKIIDAIGTTSTGSIDISVSGGTAPYLYQWTKGNTNVGTEEDLLNISAGDYTLFVKDANGCTQHSSVFTIKSLTGIEEVLGLTYFNCSPNPTNSNVKVSLHLSEAQRINAILMDATGKIIEAKPSILTNIYETQFEVANLPPAVYFLHLSVGKKQWVEKIIRY